MSAIKDLTGQQFSRWTVLIRADNDAQGQAQWHCVCQCGTKAVVRGRDLRKGKSRSCGCLQKDIAAQVKTTHGASNTRLHRIWCAMKQRCFDKTAQKYARYGGRGITVCKEWLSFCVFEKWARQNGYTDNLSIDRINNDGNYSPQNCRWSTSKEQARNKSTNHLLFFRGKSQSIAQWAEETGIGYYALRSRINQYHWPIEKALTTPLRRQAV